MKNTILPPAYLPVLAILFCLHFPAYADEEAERTALRTIKTNYEEAVSSGNLAAIAPFLDKAVTGVMVTGEAVEGFHGLEAYWKKIQNLLGPGGSYQVKVNTDKTELFGDWAVSRGGTEETVRLGNGKELKFNSLWTAVCRKESDGWKVYRMQATMDPVANVFISAQLEKAKWAFGLGGLIAGVALACGMGFLRRSTIRP
jgi:ketosteroid isomerase-like protein